MFSWWRAGGDPYGGTARLPCSWGGSETWPQKRWARLERPYSRYPLRNPCTPRHRRNRDTARYPDTVDTGTVQINR